MFKDLNLTDKVSSLYLLPPQASQTIYISDKKCIAIFLIPLPSQILHLPSLPLYENLPGANAFAFAVGVFANIFLNSSYTKTFFKLFCMF